jgi:hypothetical protein
MTSQEIQDYIHVYSIFSFKNGRREPGICVNKFNITDAKLEYFFIHQDNMSAYKIAFDSYEKDTCRNLSIQISPDELNSIRPVSLSDYKMIMELLEERRRLAN